MNAFRSRSIALSVGFCFLLGVGAASAAPEKIPPDKVVHPIMGPVSSPEIIPETRKDAVYPEKWRKRHLGAHLVLQAVIEESGSVSRVDPVMTGLRVETDCGKGSKDAETKETGSQVAPPEAGRDFEAAAISAVKRWKYRPGTMNGVPVAVYYTLIVDFTPCPKKTDPGRPPDR